ncbi:VOC family protein [Nonomuraea wenchangensis]|uniref:Glyoxalase-like domain-containing protein n=1 Tax=Nonomuraea wenchangensis TaxID=568860 RepID=A0A1H9YHE9_9ACTN|nr:VOC family protein [Nonomuraea wenchangensis]SES68446.1 hypothetical protein SAMN05421811_10142 [Nonomuraea wenchangensis]
MPHYSKLCRIVIDVEERHHADELAFWQAATGAALENFPSFPEFHGAMLGDGDFGLLLQRLDEGPARVHLDFHTDDVEAETARLERLGAKRVRQLDGRWWIMEDPAGLRFCVVPEPPGALHDGNAQRWED